MYVEVPQIDHIEPQSSAPDRVDDPSNLLPSCSTCNGPGGKWDYHPNNAKRRRFPKVAESIVNAGSHDYAILFQLDAIGSIRARHETHGLMQGSDVSKPSRLSGFAIELFHLNRAALQQQRRDLKRVLTAGQIAFEKAQQGDTTCRTLFEQLLPTLVRNLSYYQAFDFDFSTELRETLERQKLENLSVSP